MESAITSLDQLKDSDLFREVSEGVGHVVEYVDEFDAAMRRLLQTDDPEQPRIGGNRAAKVLQNLAEEEAAKVLILLDVVRCPLTRKDRRPLDCFNDHVAKGIYAEACSWAQLHFEEVARQVEMERQAYYLDGPSDADWIFPNEVTWRRQTALYVDYVRDDSDEAGRGPCFWNSPDKEPLVLPPSVIEVARALHAAGATTPEALAVVAEVWRPVDVRLVRREMRANELRDLNVRTLEALHERGLLARASEDVYKCVIHDWPFPLWPLELRLARPKDRKAEKRRLREIREARTPEW